MTTLLPTATTTEERDRNAQVAILPVGSFEQHGDHLPLSTDTIVATLIARQIAAAQMQPLRLPQQGWPPYTLGGDRRSRIRSSPWLTENLIDRRAGGSTTVGD